MLTAEAANSNSLLVIIRGGTPSQHENWTLQRASDYGFLLWSVYFLHLLSVLRNFAWVLRIFSEAAEKNFLQKKKSFYAIHF